MSSGGNICKPKPGSRMAEEWIISRRWLPCIRSSTERWSVSHRHNTILCRTQTVHNIHIKNGAATIIKPMINIRWEFSSRQPWNIAMLYKKINTANKMTRTTKTTQHLMIANAWSFSNLVPTKLFISLLIW